MGKNKKGRIKKKDRRKMSGKRRKEKKAENGSGRG